MDKQEKAAWKARAASLKSEMKAQMKGKIKMDCEKILCDRLQDAEGALKNGRNEQAEFDAALITMVLDLCKKGKPREGTVSKMENVEGGDLFAMSVEELEGAEKYYSLYRETGDARWLSMAKQELAHSAVLASMIREQGKTQDAATLDDKRHQLERVIR